MRVTVTVEMLNRLIDTPFEQWRDAGVELRAVSANSHGMVSSGILHNGKHFYKKWDYIDYVHSNPRFVISD